MRLPICFSQDAALFLPGSILDPVAGDYPPRMQTLSARITGLNTSLFPTSVSPAVDPQIVAVRMFTGFVCVGSTTRLSTARSPNDPRTVATPRSRSCRISAKVESMSPGTTPFITAILEHGMPRLPSPEAMRTMVLNPSVLASAMFRPSMCVRLSKRMFFIIRSGERTEVLPASRKSSRTNPRGISFATTPSWKVRAGSVCARGSIAPSRVILLLGPDPILETAFSRVQPASAKAGSESLEKTTSSETIISSMCWGLPPVPLSA